MCFLFDISFSILTNFPDLTLAELMEKNMKGIVESALPWEDREAEEKVGMRTSNPPKSIFKDTTVRLFRIRWIECYKRARRVKKRKCRPKGCVS